MNAATEALFFCVLIAAFFAAISAAHFTASRAFVGSRKKSGRESEGKDSRPLGRKEAPPRGGGARGTVPTLSGRKSRMKSLFVLVRTAVRSGGGIDRACA